MTMTEVIPMVASLPHADKWRLMQFLVSQLAREEEISLSPILPEKKDSLWDIVGMAEGEDAEVARCHDDYLYGVK